MTLDSWNPKSIDGVEMQLNSRPQLLVQYDVMHKSHLIRGKRRVDQLISVKAHLGFEKTVPIPNIEDILAAFPASTEWRKT